MKPLTLLAVLGVFAAAMAVTGCRTNTDDGATTNPPEEAAAADDGAPDFGEDPWGLGDAPLKGNPNGLVTIVEFSDFECPFCGRVNPTLAQVLEDEEFGDKVRIVFLQMPLPMHPNAHLAGQASLAAHAEGKFWEYHDLLFANRQAMQRSDLEGYAEQLGLDMDAFRAALDNETYKQAVDDDVATAGRLGIRGTPNFMINGRQLTGARPFDQFAEVIRAEVTAMEALIAEGKSVGEAYEARVAANASAAPPAAPDNNRRAAPSPDPNAELYVPVGESAFKGPEDALVTIVEFSEFQCPFCARVGPTLQQIADEYGDDVRVVFKHNPLDFHDRAEPAARAGIAAQAQGKFWEFHDLMFQNQRALTDENFTAWAEQLGLNIEQFNADMASDATTARIAEDVALARRLAARGTPHFFINGYRLRGAQPFDRFKQVIDERLAEARALVEGGTARAGVYDALQADAVRGDAPMIEAPAPAARPQAAPAAPAGPVEINVGTSATRGPEDAPVTIAVWTDFQCPYCTRFANNLDAALEGYEGRVRVVLKHFPLGFHQDAHLAAQAAMAAQAQGKFWEYHDTLFANQRALGRADLERYAQELGLNMDTFRAALDSGEYRAAVDAEMAEGRAVGVTGTPGWFVNGIKFGGARAPEAIRAEIDRALAAE